MKPRKIARSAVGCALSPVTYTALSHSNVIFGIATRSPQHRERIWSTPVHSSDIGGRTWHWRKTKRHLKIGVQQSPIARSLSLLLGSLTCLHSDRWTWQTEACPSEGENCHCVRAFTQQTSYGALGFCGVTESGLIYSTGDDGGVVLCRNWDVPCNSQLICTTADTGPHIFRTTWHWNKKMHNIIQKVLSSFLRQSFYIVDQQLHYRHPCWHLLRWTDSVHRCRWQWRCMSFHKAQLGCNSCWLCCYYS